MGRLDIIKPVITTEDLIVVKNNAFNFILNLKKEVSANRYRRLGYSMGILQESRNESYILWWKPISGFIRAGNWMPVIKHLKTILGIPFVDDLISELRP